MKFDNGYIFQNMHPLKFLKNRTFKLPEILIIEFVINIHNNKYALFLVTHYMIFHTYIILFGKQSEIFIKITWINFKY